MPPTAKAETARRLGGAVHRSGAATRSGMLERLFTFAFRGMVYPQIWEDPVVDMKALALGPGSRVVAIASGGCNVLSYLTAAPEAVTAVDLNGAHVALNRLKVGALRHLPDYETFYRFVGEANAAGNVGLYDRVLRPHLDVETRRYWEGHTLRGRRIEAFGRNLYRHGLFGRFIGLCHFLARRYGVDLRRVLDARTESAQRLIFDEEVAPLFEKRFVRFLLKTPASLFGLGIPPAQYEALEGDGDLAATLHDRLRRLATAFPIEENYFAWQAFGRAYAPGGKGPLPPYLQRGQYAAARERADRVRVVHRSLTEHLLDVDAGSLDAYVLLDAQDWMTDAQLRALWVQITRTARPGARVIFRTAAAPSILPGRLDPDLLSRWSYRAEESRVLHLEDRSATYGGFHLYVLKG